MEVSGDRNSCETAETKSMPKADRIRQIGARLLQQQSDPNAWWGKTPMYQLEVPSNDLQRIKEEVKKARPDVTPTDDQIQREHRRQQYCPLLAHSLQNVFAQPAGEQHSGVNDRPHVAGTRHERL